MKRFLIKALPAALLLSVGAYSTLAAASDGDITFNGQVVAAACTLNGFNGGNSANGAVMALATVTPSSFNFAGGYAAMKDFTIDMKDCDISTLKNAMVSFSGSPDTTDGSILKNTQTTGGAAGVGIAILENDGTTPIAIDGGKPSKPQALAEGNTSLLFKVAYKANTSTPAVTAGGVSAKTFVDITYN